MPARSGGFTRKPGNLAPIEASKRVSPDSTPLPRPAPAKGAGSRPAGAPAASKLRVLSFGWEFAPLLSGGLGVACAGLGRALVAEGVDLTFVLPKFPRPIESGAIRILDARQSLAASPDGADLAAPIQAVEHEI